MNTFKKLAYFCACLFLSTAVSAQFTGVTVEELPLLDQGPTGDGVFADGMFGVQSYDLSAHTRYRVFANVTNPNDAVFGTFALSATEGNPVSFTSSTNFFHYTGGFGGVAIQEAGLGTTVACNVALAPPFDVDNLAGDFPGAALTSYITAGRVHCNYNGYTGPLTVAFLDPADPIGTFLGAASTAFDGGDLVFSEGAVIGLPQDGFTAPDTYQGVLGGDDLRVELGQFTTDGDFAFTLNLQTGDAFDGNQVYDTKFYFGDSSDNLPGQPIPGSNEPIDARVDFGLNYPLVEGCTDETSPAYDPAANVSGICPAVGGCTDDTACNYDPAVDPADDDGSCIIPGVCEICDGGVAIAAPAPANDNCADATALATDGTPATGDNTCATDANDGAEPHDLGETCWFLVGGDDGDDGDLWYSFVAPAGLVTINTVAGTLTDSQMAVYDACGGNLVACDDDDADGLMSQLTLGACEGTLVEGTTYYIEVEGYNGAAGSFDISVTELAQDGCTDAMAINYNACATNDDGSCITPSCADAPLNETYCYDNEVAGVIYSATAGNYVTVVFTAGTLEGCCDVFTIYDGVDNTGTVLYTGTGSLAGVAASSSVDGALYLEWDGDVSVSCASGAQDEAAFDVYCGTQTIFGCTDPTAANFDMTATDDDGSCVFVIPGCTDMTACNFDATATEDDGSCEFPAANDACAGAEALSLDGTAATGDTSCSNDENDGAEPHDLGETCWFLVGGDDGADGDLWYSFVAPAGLVTINTVAGTLTDSQIAVYDACGGNLVACDDDDADGLMSQLTLGACDGTLVEGTTYYIEVEGYNGAAGSFDISVTELSIDGCTDVAANNYDACATVDDGSCTFDVPGCTDATACNFDMAANVDDGSCEFVSCAGCTDAMACNYDDTATIDDGSCESVSCAGCTDAGACNYDMTASIDDGSCDFSCLGCTDPAADNFDPTATIDDGSCTFPAVCGFSQLVTGCGATVSPVTGFIKAQWLATGGAACAEDYIFRFTNNADAGDVQVYNTGAAYTILFLNATSLTPGATYSVDVATVQSGSTTGYGVACDVTIAPLETALLGAYSAPNVMDLSDFIKIQYVSVAVDYTWKFTRTDDVELPFYYTPGSNFTRVDLSDLPVVAGGEYDVEARVQFTPGAGSGVTNVEPVFGADPTGFGPVQQLIIGGGAPSIAATSENTANTAFEGEPSMSVYPNPVMDGHFNVSGIAAEGMVVINILDGMGKLVQTASFNANAGRNFQQIQLNGDVSVGVYMVQIIAGDYTTTERLVVQK